MTACLVSRWEKRTGRSCPLHTALTVTRSKRAPVPMQALGFTLDELKEARLAPIVDFKGRRGGKGAVDVANEPSGPN